MSIASLSIDILARLADFERDMGKASRIAEKQAAQIERAFAGTRAAMASVGAALGASFSAAGLVQFFRVTVDGIDKLNDLKDATGASIENISALEDIAVRTGTSFESMSATLVKFNKVLSDAKPGSDAANILKAIGVNADELRRMDPAEALRQTAVALSKFADDGTKARYVQELFGKSIQEAAPFLKDLAEQSKLVATVMTKQAEEAEKFNKQLLALEKNATDIARTISGPLVAAMNLQIEKFQQAREQGKGWLDLLAQFPSAREQWSALGNPFGFGADARSVEIASLSDRMSSLKKLIDDANVSDERRLRLQNQLAGVEARRNEILLTSTAGAGRGFVHPAFVSASLPDLPDKPDKVASKQSALSRYVESLYEANVAALDLSAVEQAEFDIASGKLGKVNAQMRELIMNLAEAKDMSKFKFGYPEPPRDAFRRSELAAQEATDAALSSRMQDDANAKRERFNALLAATPTAKLDEQRKDMLLLAEALDKGTISSEQFSEAASERLGNKLQETGEQMSTFAEQASRNIQDALGETLHDTITGNFDDIGKKWGDMLLKMGAQAAAAQINLKLFGKDGGGGLLGGALTKGIDWLFSGIFHDGGIAGSGGMGRAVPALAFAGAPYFHGGGIAGDEVPAILRRGEEVLTERDPRHRKNGGAGGGTTVNVSTTMNIAAPIDARTFDTILASRDAKLKSDIQREIRHRG